MKRLNLNKFITLLFVMVLALNSCAEDYSLGSLNKPSNLSLDVVEVDPGSGKVQVSYSASNAITHKIVFNATTSPNNGQYISTVNNGSFEEKYNQTGTYEVIYYAYGTGAEYDSIVKSVSVTVDYEVDQNIITKLTNGTSKIWKWDRNSAGHLGVGQTTYDYPNWYASQPNEKPECLYNDELVFTKNADGSVTFQNINQGDTFIHVDHQVAAVGSSAGEDACYGFTTGSSAVSFSEATSGISSSTGAQMSLGNQFMSYYLGTNTYEILTLTDTELYVRTVETAPDGSLRAWYLRFKSEASGSTCTGGPTGNQSGTGTYQLVWADEFDSDLCSSNWTYDIGQGDNGWGNNEQQYYTDRPANVSVSNGSLFITAKKETYMGASYTSARVKTQNLFDFKYGRVEVRAKLPQGGGTWPAIWMLGSNIETVGWPACGEIDIMEHTGNNPGVVSSAIHTSAASGGNAVTGNTTVSSPQDWHVYSAEWTSTEIKFFVDDILFFTYNPAQNSSNWPFNEKFFIILNVAMGGNMGGNIDSNFTQSSMEVDYVRVYQK